MNSFSRFARRTPEERWLLVTTALLMSAFRLGLWLLPFQRVAALAGRRRRPVAAAAGRRRPDQIGWAVDVVGRYVPKATCLVQALTAKTLLEGAGFPADLRIGVTKGEQDGLQAHAWVETAGTVITGGDHAERYSPLTFPNS